MTTAALRAPRLSAPDLPSELRDDLPLRGAGDFDGLVWGSLAERTDAARAQVTSCVLRGARADAVILDHATLTDVVIDGLLVAHLSLRGAHVRRLEITGGRIGSLDLSEADVAEVRLADARVDYLSLSRASATDVVVAGCHLGTIDAPAARLARVAFTDSTADELDLRETRNRDVDLRGVDIAHHVDVRGLAGATISGIQAQLIAESAAIALGASVRD